MTASDDSLTALAEAYVTFLAIRRNADAILVEEQEKLNKLWEAARVLGSGTGSSYLPLDDVDEESRALLVEAERVAVHGVTTATPMSRSSEREIRDYEYLIRTQRRRFEQLLRMRQRGPLGRRPQPAAPRAVESGPVNGGEMICSLCQRDFWSPPGLELVLEGSDPDEPAVVCWICGDEHAPAITADLLAAAVLSVERWAGGTASYGEHWASLLRDMGMQQRAIDLVEALDEAKATVREMKAAALGTPETWLEP